MGSDPGGTTAGSSGFSVLDGAAMVAGAAVAAAHLRRVIRPELMGPGWGLIGLAFLWVGLTAAGPFVYLVRRYFRRDEGYPRVGDRLWAGLGLPWLLTTVLQDAPDATGGQVRTLLSTGLSLGLGVTGLLAMAVVWKHWVAVGPDEADRTFSGPWTNRVGLLLAIAWPIQWGMGMVVMG